MGAIATEAGHWYTRDGEPFYEIQSNNGTMRPTTLRDARKLSLVPSVTMIMRCAASPQLEKWKQDQLLMSALTLPKADGETLEEFSSRVVEDSQRQTLEARDAGTAIHGSIERHLCGQDYDSIYKPHVDGALGALRKWCGDGELQSEKSFAHGLGFGGKCDVHMRMPWIVADYKCKDFDENKLPGVYDNHAMQLAAYREGFDIGTARCAIIFVSTRVPGLVHLVEIDEDELARGWNMFCALLNFWKLKNRYNPEID